MVGENRLVAGSLSGASGSFIIQGAGMGRDFLVTGGGFALERNEWLRFAVDYTLQTNSRQTSHTGSGSMQIIW